MSRFVTALVVLLLLACRAMAELPPVPVPPENPITESKRILGKILFWEEQLSSDDTVACGTCHIPTSAGADPRAGLNPGADGVFGTADDVLGSPGVARRDASGVAIADPVFAFAPQVTGRAAPSFFNALWAPENFWDGRAASTFVDPLDPNDVVIASGGSLESQAVGPIVSAVEMAHDDRDWSQVTVKLAGVTPMRLADDIPPDVWAVLSARPTYADLFAAAFGDAEITPVRIAFAIATYERTLVADQTPWDRFRAGNAAALTPQQQQGWNAFQNQTVCDNCHTPPLFTDNGFHNIGLRPAAEDAGRQNVTGLAEDFGRVKTPSLRNIALQATLMHNGRIDGIPDALGFYNRTPGHIQFPENQDTVPNDGRTYDRVNVPPQLVPAVLDFLINGLTDPRAAAGIPPFDRPLLRSELGGLTTICAAAPRSPCRGAEKSRLNVNNSPDDSRDSVSWSWTHGAATGADDFGDPDSGYAFCLYDGSAGDALLFEARTQAGSRCAGDACWKTLGADSDPRGYRYSDRDQMFDGLRTIRLRAGGEGSARVTLSAKGVNLSMTPLGLPAIPLSLPLTVQLQAANGECWEAAYATSSVNEDDRFVARTP